MTDEEANRIILEVHDKFVDNQILMFPSYCQAAYESNYVQDKEEHDYGIKGKFTDTYGWSKDGTMKQKWIVPMSLQNFMQNLVYQDFWDDSNAKVRDSFMKRVCQGGTKFDYEQLLTKVLIHYGKNPKNAGKTTAQIIGGI